MKRKKVKDLSYTYKLPYKIAFSSICASVAYLVASNITSLASILFISSFGYMVYEAYKEAKGE